MMSKKPAHISNRKNNPPPPECTRKKAQGTDSGVYTTQGKSPVHLKTQLRGEN